MACITTSAVSTKQVPPMLRLTNENAELSLGGAMLYPTTSRTHDSAATASGSIGRFWKTVTQTAMKYSNQTA
ncbi:hypothetical protein D3C81_2222660 [compost metagenome]